MTPKLEIQGLSKWFGDLEVLRDIEFQIQEHEFLAIVGPSGCGKTTLLRMIAGIENADAGSIKINGRLLAGPGADRGFVFQQNSCFRGGRSGATRCSGLRSTVSSMRPGGGERASSWKPSALPVSSATIRTRSTAGCGSGSISHARWRSIRKC